MNELLEDWICLTVLIGFERRNKYRVQNIKGEDIYFAVEDCACTNNQTRTKRNKQMNKKHGLLKNCNILVLFANKLLTWMTKHYRKYNEPMKIKMDAVLASNCRTMRMCEVLCTLRMCRAFKLEVSAPVGEVIGLIKVYAVRSRHRRIPEICPVCVESSVRRDTTNTDCPMSGSGMDAKAVDGSVVGNIQKQYDGFAKEMFTHADDFRISFPMNLDVRMKAILIGACFLIWITHKHNHVHISGQVVKALLHLVEKTAAVGAIFEQSQKISAS
uniref:Phospholipid scramblase n=1 Tax=Strigamia maritima TaxID=126957 RepID=T1JGG5_STRMM